MDIAVRPRQDRDGGALALEILLQDQTNGDILPVRVWISMWTDESRLWLGSQGWSREPLSLAPSLVRHDEHGTALVVDSTLAGRIPDGAALTIAVSLNAGAVAPKTVIWETGAALGPAPAALALTTNLPLDTSLAVPDTPVRAPSGRGVTRRPDPAVPEPAVPEPPKAPAPAPVPEGPMPRTVRAPMARRPLTRRPLTRRDQLAEADRVAEAYQRQRTQRRLIIAGLALVLGVLLALAAAFLLRA